MNQRAQVSFCDVVNRCDYVAQWIDGGWQVVEREWYLTAWQPATLSPALQRRFDSQVKQPRCTALVA